MTETTTMPWGPPFPLDHDGTSVQSDDRRVELSHNPPPRRLALAAVLVGLGPALVAAALLLDAPGGLWVWFLAASGTAVVGLLLATLRTQIVVTGATLFRWGGPGRPRPESIRIEAPTVEVWQEPGGGRFVVRVHDRGETFAVAESVDRARAERLGRELSDVLGTDAP